MNGINSLILEGYVACKKEDSFLLRYKKNSSIFSIKPTKAMNGRMSDLKIGTGIRVVGRLDTYDDDFAYIIAEHIEIKPHCSKMPSTVSRNE